MISYIVEWLQTLITQIGPFGLAIATMIESFFAPIPSEVILLTAGTIAQNPFTLLVYIVFATLGSYTGTLPFFFIGKKSRGYVMSFFSKYGKYLMVNQADIEYAESKFEKYGNGIVFFGRLIPLIRSLVSIPAGISKMDFKSYTLFTLSGTAIWNTLLLACGYGLKNYVPQILNVLDGYDKLILFTFGIFLIVQIIRGFLLVQKKH